MPRTVDRDWNRLERHALECIAEAEKLHTPEEIQAAELALSDTPGSAQPSLFTPAATQEVMPLGKPNSPVRRQGPSSCE
jgi:hypothetical protein